MDITWAVQIDASTGLQALQDALADVQAQLGQVDAAAKVTGQGISSALAQGPVSSRFLEQARQELLATEKTAEGLAARIGLALQAPQGEELTEHFARIVSDYESGVASIEEALRAVGNAEHELTAKIRGEANSRKEATTQQANLTAAGVFKAVAAYDFLKNTVLGFVRAGMAGTAEAENMALTMGLISREVAGVFKPAIDAITQGMQRVLGLLQGMSGESQAMIRNVVGAGLAFTGVIAAVVSYSAAIAKAQKAMAALQAAGALNPWTIAIAGVAALLVGTEEGRAAAASLMETFGAVVLSVMPIVEAVAELASTLVSIVAPILLAIAEILQGTIVPLFELLKPIFEMIASIIRGISTFIRAIGRFFGLGGGEREAARRESVTQKGGLKEDLEGTMSRIQSAALKTDIAISQRDRMIGHLARMDRSLTGRRAEPAVTVGG